MGEYRKERDSLGEVKVPVDAYWGAQTQRAIHNFPITGLKQYPAFIWGMAIIKRAAAEVNSELGLFKDVFDDGKVHSKNVIAQAIMDASDELISGRWQEQFVVDPIQAGAGTSHNNSVHAFIDKCLVDIQGNVEKAQGWLAKNAILVTALNLVIGYSK